jgi:pyrrolidone-carboxylate peptidase
MLREAQHSLELSTRTLVTGFGPFGSFAANPSSQLAAECRRPFQILEVSYAAVDQFLSELPPESFDLLVMLGAAGLAQRLRFEMTARNWVGASPDVRGAILGPGLIDPSAPPQFSLPPSLTISTGEHWEASFDAGDYLCNYIYFRAMQRFPAKHIYFIHVPPFEVVSPEIQFAELGRMLSLLERT